MVDQLIRNHKIHFSLLVLFYVQGSACMEKRLQRGKQAIDISGLAAGTYMLLFRDKYGKTFYTEKLVRL